MGVPIIGQQAQQDVGPVFRLLHCKVCGTLEELPPFEGRPEHDHLLALAIEPHKFPSGEPHKGMVYVMPIAYWADERVRKGIIDQIKGGGSKGIAEADSSFYDSRSTFAEDALKCYSAHQRPSDGCSDYQSPTKRLLPNTSAERKEAGLPSLKDAPGPKTYLCQFCLTGDTEVVTDRGIFPISELAGSHASLLVPHLDAHGGLSPRGSFQLAPVEYFGEQPTFRVTLRRGRATKVVTTTAEHRWFIRGGVELSTEVLSVGDTLAPLSAIPPRQVAATFPAFAQGFVYGDGYAPSGEHRRPAAVTLYGDKATDMERYFWNVVDVVVNGRQERQATHLPRSWKMLPSLTESRSFLLSWLAGYFAADGTVSKGGAATISSSDMESVQFVRGLLAICGVRYGVISTRSRLGYGEEDTLLHTVSMDALALPEWFWLRRSHHERVTRRAASEKGRKPNRDWVVESVTPTGLVEPVYCAVVDGAGSFGLSDDLMTGNCPVHSVVVTRKRTLLGHYN